MKKLAASLGASLVLATVLVSLVGIGAPAAFAAGAPAPVVATYTIADQGQGCWSGGNLRSDGTGTGRGACSFSTPAGQVVAKLTGGTWTGTMATGDTVTLCANVLQIHGPAGALPPVICAPITVNGGPTVIDGTLFRVTTTG